MEWPLTSGRLPMRSIKNQGMNDAIKNHVCKNPDMRADMSLLKPMLSWKRVLL